MLGDGPDLSGDKVDRGDVDLGGGDEGKDSSSDSTSTEPSSKTSTDSSAIPEGEPQPGEDENWDEATKDARSRARQRDLPIVQPPADDEDVIPVCFGEYEPEERPCDGCALKKDCQKKYLGVG